MPTLKSKSPVKNSTLLAYFSLFLLFFLMMGCFGSRQIVVPDSLQSNSNRWEATTKDGALKIGKANFGPYKTISSEKLDSTSLISKSHSDFHMSLFNYTQNKIKRKVYALEISHKDDTAKILIGVNFITTEEVPGMFSNKDGETIRDTKDAYGIIIVTKTNDKWEFKIFDYGIDFYTPRPYNYFTSGYLIHQNDTLSINTATKFLDDKRIDKSFISKGIIIEQYGESVAALQLLGKNYVWISRELPNTTQLVIAGLFSAILSSKDL